LELTMTSLVDHSRLHRTAKYFMDSGRAPTHDAAMAMLRAYGLTIYAGDEIATSADHQAALLTLVNLARRTLLAGVAVVGVPEVMCVTSLAPGRSLRQAVTDVGGTCTHEAKNEWPAAVIGSATPMPSTLPCWRVTWDGWRGGAIPYRDGQRLPERLSISLAPALAAAVCAAEVSESEGLAGRRGPG
jgi:hypothetical protein